MGTRLTFAGLCFLLATAAPGRAGEAKATYEVAVSELSLEVQALRLMQQLNLTDDQLKDLRNLAKETAPPPRDRNGKASKEYTERLQELRDVLADPNDSDRIDELQEKLDELGEKEKPELDDGVDFTDGARRWAPLAMRKLKAPQVAVYLGQVADDVADPLTKLLEALDKVRTLKANEWREQRDGMLDEISNLVAGVDAERAGRVNDEVLALLSRVRILKDDEFKSQRPELEKAARQIIGDLGPTEVLRNMVERTLAELLSNPRLEAALKARLK